MEIPKSQDMSFWKNLFKKQHLTPIPKRFLLNDKNSLIGVLGEHLEFSHSLKALGNDRVGVFISRTRLQLRRDFFDFGPYAEHIAAPNFFDILLRVTAANQLQGYIKSLAGILPANDTAAAVKI